MKRIFFKRNEALKKYDQELMKEINIMLRNRLRNRNVVPKELDRELDDLIVYVAEKQDLEKKIKRKIKYVKINKTPKKWKRFIK